MKTQPPRIATWLLQRFVPWHFAESLAGDLLEDFERRPSRRRYWTEVAVAIVAAQTERLKGGLNWVLQGVVASWAVLAIALWSANGLEHRWAQRCANCFYPRIVALTSGGVSHWADLAQWGRWLGLVVLAHTAAGAVLAWVPRAYRSMALGVLVLSMLDWKLPLVGGFMRHVLDSRPEEGVTSNLVELCAAFLGVGIGIWIGSKALDSGGRLTSPGRG